MQRCDLVCRAQIEANITAVAQGRRTKEVVLQEAVDAFRATLAVAQQRQGTSFPQHACRTALSVYMRQGPGHHCRRLIHAHSWSVPICAACCIAWTYGYELILA